MKATLVCLLTGLVLLGCGDNIEETNNAISFAPPQNVKALSADSASVILTWTAPPGAVDPGFGGYIVRIASVDDSVPAPNLASRADLLPPGVTNFTLFSFLTDGTLSDPSFMNWAPAFRFDAPVEVAEWNLQDVTRFSGFDAGSETFNPAAINFSVIDSTVLFRMDLYLYGGVGQLEDPLALWSASRFRTDLRKTAFSSVRHQSSTLDLPLSSFPAAETFLQDTVLLSNNTIYYARVTGNSRFDTLYARIHVIIPSGQRWPDRTVLMTVSLQRVVGLRFAEFLPGRRHTDLVSSCPCNSMNTHKGTQCSFQLFGS